MNKTLCRNLYRQVEELVKDLNQFSLGFLTGQAEKVYLGACNACMARIATDPDQVSFAKNIAKIYRLKVTLVDQELWLHRGKLNWLNEEVNSPQYHFNRGIDCGIPTDEIDLEFHKTSNQSTLNV